jgi:hypothetical protein
VELLIVAAGARRDLGQTDAAVAMLQVRELTGDDPWVARLRYAYADALLAAGRAGESREWFARAAEVDEDSRTDAAERLLELDGVVLEPSEDDEPDDDELEGDGSDRGPDDHGAEHADDERPAAAEANEPDHDEPRDEASDDEGPDDEPADHGPADDAPVDHGPVDEAPVDHGAVDEGPNHEPRDHELRDQEPGDYQPGDHQANESGVELGDAERDGGAVVTGPEAVGPGGTVDDPDARPAHG